MTITQATKGISLILDPELVDIGDLTPGDSSFIVGNGSTWVAESGATARTSLGLTIGTDVQAYDSALDAISGLSTTDGNIIVGNGSTWIAESGATARTSLGLGSGDTPSFTGLNISGNIITGSIASTFGNIDIGSSNLTATGTVSLGATSFNDNNVTNIGDIQVDSVSGDADTDTKINFLGSNEIGLNAGGNEIVRVNTNGVGIGDTSPVTKFDVTSGSTSVSAKFGRHDNNGLFIHSDAGSGNYNWRITTQTAVDGALEIAPSTSTGGTTWASNVLVVKQIQRVGVNTNSPSYSLEVVGDIAYSGSLISTSDKTLKKNIQKCPDDFFEKLLELESITFNYIDEKDTKDHFGFIAQDVEKIFPNLVLKDEDGKLKMNYLELIPVLVQAVQKLHKEIKG